MNARYLIVALLVACSSTSAPTYEGDQDGDGDVTDSDLDPGSLVGRPVIYQLIVRTFGNTNLTRAQNGTLAQNGVGKFNDISDAALTSLKALGITHVWLTGVLRQATLTSNEGLPADDPDILKGRAGSFYAVRDYYDVSPDYAEDVDERLNEFRDLVERMHAQGLRVLIDLVPNHVSRAYGSTIHPERDFGVGDDTSVFFSPSNNFFYLVDPPGQELALSKPGHWSPAGVTFDGAFAPEDGGASARTPKATGNDVTSASPSANDWYETIKLNYGYDFAAHTSDYDPVPPTWEKVDAIIAYWQELGVDGFRVDMAHMVPRQAWEYLLPKARERREVYFLAEAYADLPALVDAGFDAVYHDAATDTLKRMYQGSASQADFSTTMAGIDDPERGRYLHYLENHDERRVASPIVSGSPEDTGFGSALAAKQLAPLVYLYSQGPVLVHSGQEVGETGAGAEGFGGEDGRTSIFDYWAMPSLARWVNDHAYDGGDSTNDEKALRAWYGDLLAVSQDAAALGSRYWGLEYHNNHATFADCPDAFYSFARFETDGGRVMVVVANFAVGTATSGTLRLPEALAEAAGLAETVTVRHVLDEQGAQDELVQTSSRDALVSGGFDVVVADQAAHVYVIE